MISDSESVVVVEEIENPVDGLGQQAEAANENNGQLVERDEHDAEDNLTNVATVKPKRVTRNPQPKLNEETLKGTKGIASLEKYFERVQFKGRGYEEYDLNVIMKTYEHWCHRLFPKFPFDDCVGRLEKLGTKRAVLTHIKRIRHNLFVEAEDKPINSGSEDDITTDGFLDVPNSHSQIPSSLTQIDPTFTEEQLQRMRENKEKAERLRQEKLKNLQIRAEVHLEPSSNLPSVKDKDIMGDNGRRSKKKFILDSDEENQHSIIEGHTSMETESSIIIIRSEVIEPVPNQRTVDGGDMSESKETNHGLIEEQTESDLAKCSIRNLDEQSTLNHSIQDAEMSEESTSDVVKQSKNKYVLESDAENQFSDNSLFMEEQTFESASIESQIKNAAEVISKSTINKRTPDAAQPDEDCPIEWNLTIK